MNGGKQLEPQVVVSPKIQMVKYSQSMGPTKSEVKLTKDGLHIYWWNPCHVLFYWKRRRVTALIFSNVTRAIKMPFSNYSSTPSSLQLFISSEIMSSGSRLVHNSSKTTGSNQDMLEIKKHGEKLMPYSFWSPKDSGSSSHSPDPWESYSPYVDLTWGVWFGGGELVPRLR